MTDDELRAALEAELDRELTPEQQAELARELDALVAQANDSHPNTKAGPAAKYRAELEVLKQRGPVPEE